MGGIAKIFSPPKPKPTIVPPAPAPVAPTPDDGQILLARKKAAAAASRRSGRASTILTDETLSDKLGG